MPGKHHVTTYTGNNDVAYALKHNLANISSKVIILTVPSQLALDSHTVIDNVLVALDSPQLVSDVLDIRQITRKNMFMHTATTNPPTKTSFIVKYKSKYVARRVGNL